MGFWSCRLLGRDHRALLWGQRAMVHPNKPILVLVKSRASERYEIISKFEKEGMASIHPSSTINWPWPSFALERPSLQLRQLCNISFVMVPWTGVYHATMPCDILCVNSGRRRNHAWPTITGTPTRYHTLPGCHNLIHRKRSSRLCR
jgi:hypothetical protein